MENKIKDFFNDIAKYWDNADDDMTKIEALIDKLNIKKGDMVLDVGCGKGIITPILQKHSQNKVFAIDLSDEMVKGAIEAHKGNPNLEFKCGDFLQEGYDGQFDYIVIFNAYPHFLDVKCLKDTVYKALKDEGHFAIVHSLSKEQLNTHHKQHAMGVSRPLEDAILEAKKFETQFSLEKCLDGKDSYLIVLKKES